MSEVFKLIPTPDPERVSVRVKISTANLRSDELPKVGAHLEDVKGFDIRRSTESWGKYRYALCLPSQDDGFVEYLFVRPLSDTEKNDPIPFRVTPSTEPVPWPPILEPLPNGRYINFVSNNQYPFQQELSINGSNNSVRTTPRVHVDYVLRNPPVGNSTVITKEYLSPTPWNEDMLAVQAPDPQPIRFELIANLNPDVREIVPCLHPEITIPNLGDVAGFPLGGGTSSTFAPALTGKTFTATRMQRWQPYRIRASQEYMDGSGLYHITIATAFPPLAQELTKSNP